MLPSPVSPIAFLVHVTTLTKTVAHVLPGRPAFLEAESPVLGQGAEEIPRETEWEPGKTASRVRVVPGPATTGAQRTSEEAKAVEPGGRGPSEGVQKRLGRCTSGDGQSRSSALPAQWITADRYRPPGPGSDREPGAPQSLSRRSGTERRSPGAQVDLCESEIVSSA